MSTIGGPETKKGRCVQFSPSVFVFFFTEGANNVEFPTNPTFAEIKGSDGGTTTAEGIKGRIADRGNLFHSNSEGGKKRRVLRSSRRHSLKWLLSGMM